MLGHTFMVTFKPTSSARCAASSLMTPICNHTALAPAAMASSTTTPASAELLFKSVRDTPLFFKTYNHDYLPKDVHHINRFWNIGECRIQNLIMNLLATNDHNY